MAYIQHMLYSTIHVPGNTVCVSYTNNVVVHANTNIKEGQEITTLYAAGYLFNRKEERQLKLQQQYYFKCFCEACVNNWPLFWTMTPQEAQFKCQNCQHPLGPSTGYYPHAVKVCQGCRQIQVIPGIEVLFQHCRKRAEEAEGLISAGKFTEALNVLNVEIIRLENLLVSPRMQNFFLLLKIELEKCCRLMGNIQIEEA